MCIVNSVFVDRIQKLFEFYPRYKLPWFHFFSILDQALNCIGAEGYNRIRDFPPDVSIQVIISLLMLTLIGNFNFITDVIKLLV